jgi:hypothetical protein
MVTIDELILVLPPFQNKKKLIYYDQTTKEIIDEILQTHYEYADQYDLISPFFDTGDAYLTCKYLWDFLKYKLNYTVESANEQTVKSPAAILYPDSKIDCKHYSLFAGGVLDSINRIDDTFNWFYRFAGYGSNDVEHVFVVCKIGTKEIWIDPVLDYFDVHKKPKFIKDKRPMSLYKISGIDSDPITVSTDKTSAMKGFLQLVIVNAFGLKDFLRANPNFVKTTLANYMVNYPNYYTAILNVI